MWTRPLWDFRSNLPIRRDYDSSRTPHSLTQTTVPTLYLPLSLDTNLWRRLTSSLYFYCQKEVPVDTGENETLRKTMRSLEETAIKHAHTDTHPEGGQLTILHNKRSDRMTSSALGGGGWKGREYRWKCNHGVDGISWKNECSSWLVHLYWILHFWFLKLPRGDEHRSIGKRLYKVELWHGGQERCLREEGARLRCRVNNLDSYIVSVKASHVRRNWKVHCYTW